MSYDVRTRKMREQSMADAMHQTALLICSPRRFSGTQAERIDSQGNPISREAFRQYRRAHKK